MLAPQVNIGTMEVFLRMLGKDVAATGNPDDVALVIMDQAGWHVSKRLKVPSNVRLIFLPPYSPELNPVENLWHWIKSHHTSNRSFADYDHLLDRVSAAWRSLTKTRPRSACKCTYLSPG